MRHFVFQFSLFLKDADATTDLGARIAPELRAGDVLLLEGPIGAGKSHLARAIIQSLLDQPEDIPSPTYTIMQTYKAQAFDIIHADLYRLGDASELVELDLFDPHQDSVTLIEWPDRLGSDAPKDALWISLDAQGDGRHIALRSASDRWADLAQAVSRD